MEPTQRKMKILEAVVEAFIKTGEPVGSKALCELLDFVVSSATIRNDMAELADLGMLEQTHTSSGRIPTELGYRVYIDKLMKTTPLTKQEQTLINDALYLSADAPEHLLEQGASMLSKITGCMTVAASPSGENALIRHVRFVQTGSRTAMAVLITSTGTVKTKLFRCDFLITPQIIELFDQVINEKFSGLPVTGVTPAFMQTAAVSLGEMSMIMPNVLLALHDAAKEAASTSIAIKGQSNLFGMPELNVNDAQKVAELLSRNSELSKLIETESTRPCVILGSELNCPPLSNMSISIAQYAPSENCAGVMGVVGPLRMNYQKTVSALEYVTQTVGALLGELIDGN